MENISAFGTKLTIVSLYFPLGFKISEFADDANPIQFEEMKVADHQFLINGGIHSFKTANAIVMSVAVIPGSDSDVNLSILLSIGKGDTSRIRPSDKVIATLQYPNAPAIIFSGGYLQSGPPAPSVSSQGRKTANVYRFVFEAKAEASVKSVIIDTIFG